MKRIKSMCHNDIPFSSDADNNLTFELLWEQIPFVTKWLLHWKDGFKHLSVDEGVALILEFNERLPVIKRFVILFEKLKIVKKTEIADS